MKKFLAILLIALVACNTVEEDILKTDWIMLILQIVSLIKEKGWKDGILEALKTYGLPAAKDLCCQYLPDYCGYCEAVIQFLK